jgi:glycosyltransferase involved in cell wall biosynthesis
MYTSIIIPTFNRASLVKEAIESVLAQTNQQFELIVVDDGSTDNTSEILSSFEGRIQTIQMRHTGPSAARNRGIREARGDFIAFLDSDDLWLPEKLKKQIDFFENRPEVLICQTEETWIRNGVRVNPLKKHTKYSGWIFCQCLPLCIVSPSSVMLHRRVLEKVGLFDEGLLACEDYDLWLRIASRYPIYLIKERLIVKRGGHQDQQSQKFPAMDRFRIRSLCKILESGILSISDYEAALNELRKKCRIYRNGCLKRCCLLNPEY